ncbi:unnamed protein product [Symbiodinium sp. CCMP2592]|nr:unnamed protein product [Symbiodinium sp. CCMP2592]
MEEATMNVLSAQSYVLKIVLQKGFILSYQKLKTALTSRLEQERDDFEKFVHRRRAGGEFVPPCVCVPTHVLDEVQNMLEKEVVTTLAELEQAANTYHKSLHHDWDMYELREDAEEAW